MATPTVIRAAKLWADERRRGSRIGAIGSLAKDVLTTGKQKEHDVFDDAWGIKVPRS